MNHQERKIIHIDMDCFYAAVEIRDNPALANQPVAVGGTPDQRGVLCTCNYVARQYGIRSAMATATAYKLCKNLILLPVNMAKYKEVSQRIQSIFREFTQVIEPLSLDEAYLDVTGLPCYQGSATLIAKAIRKRIWETEQLTASAGVAPNKFLAKIASGWKKPNGLFVIRPHEVNAFIEILPVENLFGVGKVTAEKLHQQGLKTCADLQKLTYLELIQQFGKLGQQLFNQSRGIDLRAINPSRERKSLSVETTFRHDIAYDEDNLTELTMLYDKLVRRLTENKFDNIKSQFIKIKLNNFKLISMEMAVQKLSYNHFKSLFLALKNKVCAPMRLLGIGVHFHHHAKVRNYQYSLFNEEE